MDNRCVICGSVIPEGLQVCGICSEKMAPGAVVISIDAPEPRQKKCYYCIHHEFCWGYTRPHPCDDYVDAALINRFLNAIPEEVRNKYEGA